MFVRKKNNKSGLVSVQVIDKSLEQYKVVQTMGSSCEPDVVHDLFLQGVEWITQKQRQLRIDFSSERQQIERFLGNII